MNDLVPAPMASLIAAEDMPGLLSKIRPHWQSRSLIERVKRLIKVDPSSACQRILNAAVHDLREKVCIAGVDIAGEAAKQHKLPPVTKLDDVENYSTSNIIDLSYRIGLLTRSEWKRLSRCYEIRRDLEHEDDEYEAGIEDVIYVFKTCIDVVLSRDPVDLVRITDFKDQIEQPSPTVPNEALLEDFKSAPQVRQEEIGKFLLSVALDKNKPDLVQQNAFVAIGLIAPILHNQARANLGAFLQDRIGRSMDERQARVAASAGLMPYVRQAARIAFFEAVHARMEAVGHHWSGYNDHGELLRSFLEYGGLDACPADQKRKILRWLVLTYIGEPGGRTSYGNVRHVFYSNSAVRPIRSIIQSSKSDIRTDIETFRSEKEFSYPLSSTHVERRFEDLLDIASSDS